ncbi:hypothetical protein LR007_02810 [candidate division NPL-UPA2 bacterium]|nr:hypothetical protein [candidate division NPL-UPA2 bacterium]
MAEKASSLGGKAGDALFRGVMYILYGKRAGETKAEKAARLGLVVIFLVALIVIFSMAKTALFPQPAIDTDQDQLIGDQYAKAWACKTRTGRATWATTWASKGKASPTKTLTSFWERQLCPQMVEPT